MCGAVPGQHPWETQIPQYELSQGNSGRVSPNILI